MASVSIGATRKDNGSSLRGLVKVTRDITGQRIEEEQRRIIVEASPNGMAIGNEAGVITLANSRID